MVEEIDGKYRLITITNKKDETEKTYQVPFRSRIRIKNNTSVKLGDQITDGVKNPHDILAISGVKECAQYLTKQVQDVYKSQGVDINDKHIETIVRQMLKKVTIVDQGDSQFLPGQLVDRLIFEKENKKLSASGQKTATAKQNLMGITKASLATDSFLAAASFQETTKVLTDAALENRVDYLMGLKENVIIGKAIPAGTGLREYRGLELVYPGYEEEEKDEIEIYQDSGEEDKEGLEINI